MDIQEIERSIRAVEAKIEEVEKQLTSVSDPEEWLYLRKKKEQLRKEKEQLREEEQLRELLLLKFKVLPPASLGVTPAGSEWVRLARAMKQQVRDAAGVFVERNIVRLDTKLPGMEESRGALWVHWSYVTLVNRMVRLSEQGRDRFHLIGTAGCGKSAFGFLWLYYLACQRQKVLFRAKDGTSWVFFDFSGEDVQVLQAESRSSFSIAGLLNDQTWLIVDGASGPVVHPGPVLQCVSDQKQNHHEFAKNGIYLYMSAWTLGECEQAAEDCGWEIADLLQRFYYIGGVPRYLFEPGEPGEGVTRAKMLVDEAFDGITTPKRFRALLCKPWTINDISDKLFHYRYPPDFFDEKCLLVRKELVPVSDYVIEKADEFLKLSMQDKADAWLTSSTAPQVAVLRGKLFERRVHEKMVDVGGKFRCRCLCQSRNIAVGETEEWEITRPATNHTLHKWQLMDSLATLSDPNFSKLPRKGLKSLGTDSYVRAVSRNQMAWDSFRIKVEADGKVVVHIYQVTVRLSNPVKWDGISELMSMLTGALQPLIASFVLVFVVPVDKFADFKNVQRFLSKVGQEYKRLPTGPADLDQYVLEFKL